MSDMVMARCKRCLCLLLACHQIYTWLDYIRQPHAMPSHATCSHGFTLCSRYIPRTGLHMSPKENHRTVVELRFATLIQWPFGLVTLLRVSHPTTNVEKALMLLDIACAFPWLFCKDHAEKKSLVPINVERRAPYNQNITCVSKVHPLQAVKWTRAISCKNATPHNFCS